MFWKKFWKKKNKKESTKEENPIGEAELFGLNWMMQEIQNNPSGTGGDVIPEGIGEFGLEVTNPIPVKGIMSNEIYLQGLRQENGGEINWRRIGSTLCDNIDKPIDMYEIRDKQNNVLCKLYISPYHKEISNRAPKGFVLG